MDYKEKVEYLSTYRAKLAKIAKIKREYEKWLTLGTKVNRPISPDAGGSGGNSNKIERAAIEMGPLGKYLDEAEAEKEKILGVIYNGSQKMRYAEVLKMHFIDGMSLYAMARSLDKNLRTIQRVLKKAIDTLDM